MNMQKKENEQICCESEKMGTSCCKVESVVTIDSKGQILLPKELRKAANIDIGDKFAVISCEKNGDICCLSLIKVDYLGKMVRNFLGPIMQDIINE